MGDVSTFILAQSVLFTERGGGGGRGREEIITSIILKIKDLYFTDGCLRGSDKSPFDPKCTT